MKIKYVGIRCHQAHSASRVELRKPEVTGWPIHINELNQRYICLPHTNADITSIVFLLHDLRRTGGWGQVLLRMGGAAPLLVSTLSGQWSDIYREMLNEEMLLAY